jgi:hypothetical protein
MGLVVAGSAASSHEAFSGRIRGEKLILSLLAKTPLA